MNPIFQVLIPIFIAVASGLMLAGESEQGTLRACLVRPVPRRRLILGKFMILCAYTLSISFFLLVLLMIAGISNFGTGNLYTLNILFNNGQEGASTILAPELPIRFVMAGLIASLGMMVLAALALLISSLVETAAMAYVLTLSIYFALLTLRSFPFLEWLYPYLLVTHMLRWQQCFYSFVKTGEVLESVVHLFGYLIVLLSATIILFEDRDIKT
jgi:ABC-2 type transport system permease protein